MKQPVTRERSIRKEIMRAIRQLPGVYAFPYPGTIMGVNGIPDIIGARYGRAFAVEVKTTRGRVSKVQEITMAAMQRAGWRVGVARSKEEALRIIMGDGHDETE
jgi:hypothetical protein